MTRLLLTEFVGGNGFELDDLDPSTLSPVGGGPLHGAVGPSLSPAGDTLVAEIKQHRVALAEPGQAWVRLGAQGTGDGEFTRPAATAFDPSGRLLVADAGNRRVVRVDDIGGSNWMSYGQAGTTGAGRFADPRGIAVDTEDRIWVSDPGARRVTTIDDLDGSGWAQVPLPAGSVPYGICAHGDGVAIVDVGRRCLVVIAGDGATESVDLDGAPWIAPTFVASAGTALVVADIRANELRLLEPGTAGWSVTATLRGSPPDLPRPLFDSIGGIGS